MQQPSNLCQAWHYKQFLSIVQRYKITAHTETVGMLSILVLYEEKWELLFSMITNG